MLLILRRRISIVTSAAAGVALYEWPAKASELGLNRGNRLAIISGRHEGSQPPGYNAQPPHQPQSIYLHNVVGLGWSKLWLKATSFG